MAAEILWSEMCKNNLESLIGFEIVAASNLRTFGFEHIEKNARIQILGSGTCSDGIYRNEELVDRFGFWIGIGDVVVFWCEDKLNNFLFQAKSKNEDNKEIWTIRELDEQIRW